MLVTQSWLTFSDLMACSPPASCVHGILQARILEWVAISFSRGFFWPRNWTRVSHIAGRHFIDWATREALVDTEYWRHLDTEDLLLPSPTQRLANMLTFLLCSTTNKYLATDWEQYGVSLYQWALWIKLELGWFLADAVVKNPPANAGDARDMGWIPGAGKIRWRRKWQSTPVFLPGNSTERGAWQATVHGVTKSDMTKHTVQAGTQNDHSPPLSIHKSLSQFLTAPLQRGGAPSALGYKHFFTLFIRNLLLRLSSSHWISINGLCFFPQGLNLYLFLLNITLFKNLLNFNLPWLVWIIQCKSDLSTRLDPEMQ